MSTDEAVRWIFVRPAIEAADRVARGPESRQDVTGGGEPRLSSLVPRSATEERCRSYLEQLRWPDGAICPRCGRHEGISRIETRGQFDCATCGYQFSVRVGTILQNSHLPLWKWLLAAYIMCESERGVSANKLKELLGVPYKTAWYLCHRIRAAMKDETRPSPDGPEDRRGATWRSNISPKHLPRYLDELAFRSRNRDNPYLFRDILLRLMRTESMPYAELIATA